MPTAAHHRLRILRGNAEITLITSILRSVPSRPTAKPNELANLDASQFSQGHGLLHEWAHLTKKVWRNGSLPHDVNAIIKDFAGCLNNFRHEFSGPPQRKHVRERDDVMDLLDKFFYLPELGLSEYSEDEWRLMRMAIGAQPVGAAMSAVIQHLRHLGDDASYAGVDTVIRRGGGGRWLWCGGSHGRVVGDGRGGLCPALP
eukprot:SAG11_NODE_2434_length_3366_cov_9.631466_5_plen_201_part_00